MCAHSLVWFYATILSYRTMVLRTSGPIPMYFTGTPVYSSTYSTNSLAALGREA